MESGILYAIYNEWIRSPQTSKIPYKIGITRGSIEDRYYGLGLKMPGKFETLFAYKFNDCSRAEQLIHGILNKFRENGEWFTITNEQLKLVKDNCELMGGILVTDEVKNEIEIQTEENELEEKIIENEKIKIQNILQSEKLINPNFPCKVIMFNIGNAIKEGHTIYDSTRASWKISEKYRDINEYRYVVGLQRGYSLGAFKINKWNYTPDRKRHFLDGEDVSELTGYSWYRQISVNMGWWQRGSHFVVEFNGTGQFRLIRPHNEEWIECT